MTSSVDAIEGLDSLVFVHCHIPSREDRDECLAHGHRSSAQLNVGNVHFGDVRWVRCVFFQTPVFSKTETFAPSVVLKLNVSHSHRWDIPTSHSQLDFKNLHFLSLFVVPKRSGQACLTLCGSLPQSQTLAGSTPGRREATLHTSVLLFSRSSLSLRSSAAPS